jgi:hypothetical protein
MERLLSTIISPVFSEIVIIFSGSDVYRPPETLASVIREFCGTRELRVAFCLETSKESEVEGLRKLTLETERTAAAGLYDFLPCPPLVFSRAVTKYV